MTLNEQLMSLKAYSVGFNIYEGTVVVNVTYPNGWGIINPNVDDIKMFAEEGKHYYCISIDKDINSIFELIDATIEHNKELEAKVALFNSKINELKQLFIDEGYETLLGLTFNFKKKRKYAKKSEKKEILNDNVPEEKIDGDQEESIDEKIEMAIEQKEINNN